MGRPLSRGVLWVLVALGMAAGAYSLVHRVQAESANRTVQLVVDYFGLQDFCEAEGVQASKALAQLKGAGVNAIAFPENNAERLRDGGRIAYYGGGDFVRALRSRAEVAPAGMMAGNRVRLDPKRAYVVVSDPALLKELKVYLRLALGSARMADEGAATPSPQESGIPSLERSLVTPAPGTEPKPFVPRFRVFPSEQLVREDSRKKPVALEVDTSERALRELSMGFSRDDLALAQEAGLDVYLRPENRASFTERDVKEYFSIMGKLKRFGVKGIIFSGGSNEVVGFPDALPTTVEAMRAHELIFGNIEVPTVDAAQKGSRTLGVQLSPQTVRVMSFSPQVQAKLSPEDVVDKFVLGVRERNIRLLYLRFFTTAEPGKTLVQTNLDYIRALADALESAGFHLNTAQPFASLQPPLWALLLMSLGMAAGACLLLGALIPLTAKHEIGLMALCVVLPAALDVMGRQALWTKTAALGTALVFASLGLVLLLPRLAQVGSESSPAQAMWRAVVWLTQITLLSVGGGVILAGLLAATPFMLSVDQARGIKLIMLLPPALVTWYYVTRVAPNRLNPWTALRTHVSFWHLAVLAIFAGVGAFYILRTGNAAPGAASDFEISLRNFLENVFIARPRFKEFALGHPAWVLAALLVWERRALSWTWVLVLCAGIGQADILDTFCHIHTPFLVSLLRVVHGLWLGALVGFAVGIATLWLFWKGNPPADARSSGSGQQPAASEVLVANP
ncbi:MAG: hypothetical protein FJX76_22715 [Armatimonadetes bacterium]|nr:hypothetical protein [Armatimonadota bacterium]